MIVYTYENRFTADSYLSVSDLENIFESSFFLDESKINSLNIVEKENLLIAGTSVCDNLFSPFVGDKYDLEQSLEFPRNFQDKDFIVSDVKEFICFLVEQLIDDASVFTKTKSQNENKQVKKLKLDALEKEFFENKIYNYEKSMYDNINSYALSLIETYQEFSDNSGVYFVQLSRS